MSDRGLTRAAAVGLLGAGGAVIAAGFWVKNESVVEPQALVKEAEAAKQRTEQAIEALGRVLEPRAADAARLQPLTAGLDSGADPGTFQDLFETEDWWAGVRKASPYSALVAGSELYASVGLEKLDVAGSPLVARARQNKLASGLVRGASRAYLVAAALVTRGKTAEESRPVVLVGEIFDESHLTRLADRTGDAVGISDGRKLLDSAGPAERRRLLQKLVGREAQGPIALENGFMATALPVAPGLTLWAVSSSPAPTAADSSRPMVLWGLGAAVVGIGLGLLGRRRQPQRTRHEQEADPRSALNRSNRMYIGTREGYTRDGHHDPREAMTTPTAPPVQVEAPRPPAHTAPLLVPDATRIGHVQPALAATAVAAPASDMMGRYTLLERIGEGGMAEIYIAAAHGAEGFERRFVVKRLHAHLARRKEAVSQFIDEARLQAQLVHSNIVPVFDFGRVGEEYFLALEYIHGRDFEKLLQRHIAVFNRPLDLPVVAYVVHEVQEALAYAHSKRDQAGRPLEIVHRDISPANILISYQGEVKLTDFGIVKAGGRVSQTEMGMVKGNASFMSPEQARGTKVDARSDLFSSGVVMFCGLTGQALYQGETTLNQLVRAAVGPATSQFQQIETLPAQSVPVLSKALMLDPAHRYQSAAEFARDLAPLIPGVKGEVARLMEQLFPDTSPRATG